jgi:nicotinamidase-related amidase
MVSYTLVVVDMQPNFNAAMGKRVRANVLREIKQAIEDHAGIIFLEYWASGHTHDELLKAVESINYKHYNVLTKHTDDGSKEVWMQINEPGYSKSHIKVCGVNTDCCVYSTVCGLTGRLPRTMIEVIEDACASDWNHTAGISRVKSFDNVNVRM